MDYVPFKKLPIQLNNTLFQQITIVNILNYFYDSEHIRYFPSIILLLYVKYIRQIPIYFIANTKLHTYVLSL